MSESSITTLSLDESIEKALIGGDLSKLTPEQRVNYYRAVCQSVGLNPLTRPFDYIVLNGKLVLYAKKDATEQLRKNNGVSIPQLDNKIVNDVYLVTAHAVDKAGRTDVSTGAVSIANLKGVELANAVMKAETKAKRRVTLSICGLGMLDETEVETIPGAKVIPDETVTVIEPSNNGHKTAEEVNVILDDLGYEPKPPFEPKMSLESASKVTDSEGNKYGDMDAKRLQAIDRAITLKLHKNGLTPVEREELQYKLDAIAVLLHNK